MVCVCESVEKHTDSYHHELDTIEILDFASRPWRVSMFIHGHVHVASEGSLRHDRETRNGARGMYARAPCCHH